MNIEYNNRNRSMKKTNINCLDFVLLFSKLSEAIKQIIKEK